ncbi:MAG: methyltransferase [Propionibacteriaceae bacterium]|jgi:hypothetical protein|nr:methyltransferase [Propionibacteriaceae bacterium]
MEGADASARLPLALALEESGLDVILDSLPAAVRNPHNVRLACGQSEGLGALASSILRLFVYGDSVAISDLPSQISEGLTPLVKSGFCTTNLDGRFQLSNLTVTRVQGLWYFYQFPTPEMTLYFGDDTLSLINRLPSCVGAALDLCSGPGAIGLTLAQRGAIVTAGEINPIALELSTINAAMNGLSEVYRPRLGNLLDVVEPNELFDVVAWNPPLVPVPPNLSYPFVGDGGLDGMTVTWRVLSQVGDVLTDRGRAQTLGVTLASDGRMLALHKLEEVARKQKLSIHVTVTGRWTTKAAHPWCQMLARTILGANGEMPSSANCSALSEVLESSYSDAKANEVIYYYLRACHGKPTVRIVDFAPMPVNGLSGGWYAPLEGV